MNRTFLLLIVVLGALASVLLLIARTEAEPPVERPSDAAPTDAPAVTGTLADQTRRAVPPSVVAPSDDQPSGAPPQFGTLVRFDGEPAAGFEYWLWSDGRPSWTRAPATAGHCAGERELGEAHGTTDDGGRWRWAEPPRAVTFRVSGAAVVSYVVTDQHRLVLPELGEISTLLEGATPNDRWEILCTPAFATAASNGLEYECAVHVVYPIATACGPAAVSVVQRHWRGRGDETARQNGVVGLPVQLLASGERLAIEPEVSHAAPPTAVTFRVDARQPVLDVEVVDVTGTTVAIGGLSSLTRGGSRTIHAELAEGRAALSAAFTPGPPYRADVLTADGEFFSAPFAFDGEPRSSMRFVRGAGRAPLVLDLGREVAIDDVVTIALATTALRFASRTVHLLAFDTDTAAFGAVDARTLWLQDAGLGWLSAHVILRDGRVALLHRTQPTSAVGVEVEWLATVALEPVELGGQERGERGQFEFRLGIPGAADPHWVTLRSLQYGRETGPWPTWRLVAPIGYGHQLRHRRVGHADVVTDVRALR